MTEKRDHKWCSGVVSYHNETRGIVFVVCHEAFLRDSEPRNLIAGILDWKTWGYTNGYFVSAAYVWIPAFQPGHEP